MTTSGQSSHPAPPDPTNQRTHTIIIQMPKIPAHVWIGVTSVVVIIGAAAGILTVVSQSYGTPTISRTVIKETPFAIYVPATLPASYRVDATSYHFDAAQQILSYRATDPTGDNIAFSEQRKPTTVNFGQIYSKMLSNSSDLPNMPYPSTVGTTLDRQTQVLSIVTPSTWVVVTTQASLNDRDLQTIAQSVARAH